MRKKLLILAAVVALLGAILAGLATFWTEYQWFVHLDFGDVYLKVLLAKAGTGAVFGLIALAVLAVHIHFIRRFSKPRTDWTFNTPEGDVDFKELVSKVSTPVVIAGALVLASGMGYWASMHWEDVLKWLNQTSFNESEPILGKDIGFYLFELPFLQFAQEWLIYLMGGAAAAAAGVYMSRNAIEVKGHYPEMSQQVRAHLLVSLAVVAVVVALGFRVEMFETLFSKRGVAYGATYTDVNANLIAYRIIIVASLVCALFLLATIRWKREGKAGMLYPLGGVGVLVVLYALGVFAWPTVVQRFVVDPNELDKERPYLENAIAGTRKAYQLDRIEVREFPATEGLTSADLANNRGTLDNVKIWDNRPLRETYRQLQVIRLYYDFPNISVDRYRIGDHYWQVMLSARELVPWQLPQQSQTWVNEHLQYTHGYGVCLSPVNQSVSEGLPDLWVKDIPPVAKHPDLKVDQPEIYYGLAANNYVLVKTTTQEFDYPRGDDNVYTNYQGKGGVGIGGFWRRLLFAIRFADVNLLFTEHITEESRILFNRSIQERIATAAPFLMLDQEPYVTVADGRMYWIQDAYTISYRYPYSQPTQLGSRRRINYIRNSVKVVVDAFHGSVSLYVWDEQDPMIKTYAKMFPQLFRNRDEMPKALRPHVRYPKDLFTLQASMYESFHMTDPRVFYNQEDKWNIAAELEGKTIGRRGENQAKTPGVNAQRVTQQSRMSPYYMIMKLPGVDQEEFLIMVPFTPNNKDNMVAWMTAGCDGENYGKLLVYAFPKQKLIFGPMQIEARIDQDDYISQWITLRNQQGSTVIRGDLLVIPIEQSILYVEPIYLQSTQTQLPELKQVIVAFGQRLAMKPTLEESLRTVFGVEAEAAAAATKGASERLPRLGDKRPEPPTAVVAPVLEGVPDLAASALEHYETGQKKLGDGDWAGYGEQQKQLEQRLRELAKVLQKRLAPRAQQPAVKPVPVKAPAKPAVKPVPVKAPAKPAAKPLPVKAPAKPVAKPVPVKAPAKPAPKSPSAAQPAAATSAQ